MKKSGTFGLVRRVFSLCVIFALAAPSLATNRGVVPAAFASSVPAEPKIAIAAGGSHSLALKEDGTVWTWGENEFGQLGAEGSGDRLTPGQVDGLSGIVDIAGGYAIPLLWTGKGTYGHGGATTSVSSGTARRRTVSFLRRWRASGGDGYRQRRLSYIGFDKRRIGMELGKQRSRSAWGRHGCAELRRTG
nr:hypothetical protein [Cohnella faecalis]